MEDSENTYARFFDENVASIVVTTISDFSHRLSSGDVTVAGFKKEWTDACVKHEENVRKKLEALYPDKTSIVNSRAKEIAGFFLATGEAIAFAAQYRGKMHRVAQGLTRMKAADENPLQSLQSYGYNPHLFIDRLAY